MSPTQPHHEPLGATVLRNGLLALGAGTLLAVFSARSAHPVRWPVAVAIMLWPTFGGHWLEIWYLKWLRPRLPAAHSGQRLARIGTWFFGGCAIGTLMALTARLLAGAGTTHWPAWWLAGLAFVALELVVHAALHARGKSGFFGDQRV